MLRVGRFSLPSPLLLSFSSPPNPLPPPPLSSFLSPHTSLFSASPRHPHHRRLPLPQVVDQLARTRRRDPLRGRSARSGEGREDPGAAVQGALVSDLRFYLWGSSRLLSQRARDDASLGGRRTRRRSATSRPKTGRRAGSDGGYARDESENLTQSGMHSTRAFKGLGCRRLGLSRGKHEKQNRWGAKQREAAGAERVRARVKAVRGGIHGRAERDQRGTRARASEERKENGARCGAEQ